MRRELTFFAVEATASRTTTKCRKKLENGIKVWNMQFCSEHDLDRSKPCIVAKFKVEHNPKISTFPWAWQTFEMPKVYWFLRESLKFYFIVSCWPFRIFWAVFWVASSSLQNVSLGFWGLRGRNYVVNSRCSRAREEIIMISEFFELDWRFSSKTRLG